MELERNQEYIKNILSMSLKSSKASLFILDVEKDRYVYMENTEKLIGSSSGEIYEALDSNRSDLSRESIAKLFMHPEDVQVREEAFEKALGADRPKTRA